MPEGGNDVDAKEYAQTIGEIREWLVRIDTNLAHQTKLLEAINQQSSNAFEKADSAEDIAEEALKLAQKNEKDFEDYVKDERATKRWLVGIVATSVLALLPIIDKFYF